LKNQWAWDIPSITEGEIAFERFIKQHIFDKNACNPLQDFHLWWFKFTDFDRERKVNRCIYWCHKRRK